MKMGYCAKVRIYSHIYCVIVVALFLSKQVCDVHGASKGSSWPSMKTYDIWGSPQNKAIQHSGSGSTMTASNDLEIQDYRHKTSFRNEKVLSFFAQPSEDECKSEDGLRSGVCMNKYDCHQKGGTAKGQCALGFGACCVFTATCDQEIKNNITYFISPNFPALMSTNIKTCKLKIKMMSSDISQLRFDFHHFSIGQPNRQTGNCDGDIFSLFGGSSGMFKLCGYNNGQHIYYDVPNRKARDGKTPADIDLVMNFTSSFATARFWEVRVSQIPFSQRAPAGCLQYFFGADGIIQTFNFAENGRHLSNQKYKACIRQESKMCSIAYEPCNEQSFRIGPNRPREYPNPLASPYSSYNGAFPYQTLNGNPIIGPNGMLIPNPYGSNGILPPNRIVYDANGQPAVLSPNGVLTPLNPNALTAQMSGIPLTVSTNGADGVVTQADPAQDPSMLNSLNGTSPDVGNSTESMTNATTTTTTSTTPIPQDDVEGSGDDGDDNNPDDRDDLTSLFSIGSFITRAALFRRSIRSVQPAPIHNERKARQFYSTCNDRITLPCIVEDFISVGSGSLPTCSPVHCGNSLCPGNVSPCRVESTVTPFGIGIHFGDGLNKGFAEENIGACIRYKQLNCI
ncbi:uncharacterized protein LOC116340997 isoform X2 [Contarinia nasturtii]|uniref:uncharacterized protein LOC116340997 isoform X2 n=1 Tax=Contarinia nasturtii TaxID=265458 RepID=UPI0012D3BAAF|nr:uncharacterized protein LOC116340997 isoform X2 [Contarinia nasturtii]